MALLAAEAKLFVFLRPLVVGTAGSLAAAGAGALVVLADFLLDTNIEEIGLLGTEITTARFLTL